MGMSALGGRRSLTMDSGTSSAALSRIGWPSSSAGQRFTTEFSDHMIFIPGAAGTTVIRNLFDDPVYVIGEVGKGRVLFSGCYYGYRGRLQGAEKDAVLGLTAWLAGAGR